MVLSINSYDLSGKLNKLTIIWNNCDLTLVCFQWIFYIQTYVRWFRVCAAIETWLHWKLFHSSQNSTVRGSLKSPRLWRSRVFQKVPWPQGLLFQESKSTDCHQWHSLPVFQKRGQFLWFKLSSWVSFHLASFFLSLES